MSVKLPLGIEDFAKMREGGYHYIDKTAFIKELLNKEFEANLITRPRRFGKSLTMSMLEDFFDISRDSKSDFDGLDISKETTLCEQWMNKWPVVALTIKGARGLNYEYAYGNLEVLIANLCKKYAFLESSDRVDDDDKKLFRALKSQSADKSIISNSLVLLTRMMHSHYGKQVILLMDEYDVPLAAAYENGYYDEMLDIIRSLLGEAIKTNPHLKFAVITGCLRISKESIFTGVNNLVTDSITGDRFGEYIGFTSDDVKKILEDTGFAARADDVKRWYDGYRFGRTDVYCPWDVLNFISDLDENPNAKPGNYWGNTSHNAIIRQFIDRKDLRDKENINADFERLIAGESISKPIREDLTYDTIHSSSQNLWSLLLLSGYLTIAPSEESDTNAVDEEEISLRIPNEEVRHLFRTTVKEWFSDKVQSEERSELFHALWSKDENKCSKQLSSMIYDTISCYDAREDFYRAFMVGVLSFAGYIVITNKEMGEGRPDIVLKDERNDRAMVIELKQTPQKKQMEAKCEEALKQIRDKRYADGLEEEFDEVIRCGICFFKKQCIARFDK